MNVDFQGRGFLIPAALAQHVRRRLHDLLVHRGDLIQRIVVRLGGAQGGLGRHDMYCLMQVHLPHALVATVVDVGPQLHDVVDRTTDRVGRLVAACLDQAARERRSTASDAPVRAPAAELHPGARIRPPRSMAKVRRPAWSWNGLPSHS